MTDTTRAQVERLADERYEKAWELAAEHAERTADTLLALLARAEAAERVCEAAADVIDWTGEDLLNGRPFGVVSDVYRDALTAWRATQAQKEGEA